MCGGPQVRKRGGVCADATSIGTDADAEQTHRGGKEKENVLITIINSEAVISNYVRYFNNITDKYSLTVYGMPAWNNFDNIEIDYLQNLHLHLFSPSLVNYERNDVKQFVQKFRTNYKTEPDKFAFQSFGKTLVLNNDGSQIQMK